MKPINPVGRTRGWSQWTCASQFRDQPSGPGEYMVRATLSGHPITIARKTKDDANGILYIGETKDLDRRFLLLVKSLQDPIRKTMHHAAKRYFSSAQLQAMYPLQGLQVRYKTDHLQPLYSPSTDQQRALATLWPDSDGKARAVIGERSELYRYEAEFGELPVLNRKRGNKI